MTDESLDVVFDARPENRGSAHPPRCMVNEEGDATLCVPHCPVSFPNETMIAQVDEILESARVSIPPSDDIGVC